MVNCGIGIQYAENSPNGEIGYGVTAGVIGLLYIGVVAWWYLRPSKSEHIEDKSGESSALEFDGPEKSVSN
jgi:hypothetical protein